MIVFFVLLSQKHNRYHYAGEQQTQYYGKKKVKRNANPKTNPIITSQHFFPNRQNKILQYSQIYMAERSKSTLDYSLSFRFVPIHSS